MGQVDAAELEIAAESSELRKQSLKAMVAQRKGDAAAGAAALRKIQDQFGESALYEQSQILAQWGAIDRGMETLLRAAATGDPGIMLIKTDPLVDPLRRRPEFSGLLRQAGFG